MIDILIWYIIIGMTLSAIVEISVLAQFDFDGDEDAAVETMDSAASFVIVWLPTLIGLWIQYSKRSGRCTRY